ncbi:oligosaccharide flippase family protein [Pseudocitrobacter faecalis]|uniref:oligosaccharide flippase family protein n=1 Tax=Pseudocitrobacter faecalis TaxID=1398493 RepID=UPI0039EE8F18
MKILHVIRTHKLIKNTFSLFLVQLANFAAPLLVLPYLSRVLGVDGFGKTMVILSICSLGLIFTDFGFNLSASYKIAKSKGEVLHGYINSVIHAKIFLAIFFFVGVYLYNYYVLKTLSFNEILFIVSIILAQACYPTWFFQGMEKMRAITIYMMLTKFLYIIFIYVFVRNEGSVEQVIASYALSCIIGGIAGIYLMYREGVRFIRVETREIYFRLKESFIFFISRASYSMYTTASTFIVGAIAGMQQAAFYSAAEKIYQALQALTSPVTQALYPYVAKRNDHKMVLRVILILGVPMLIVSFIGYLLAPAFIKIFYGSSFLEATPIFNVFIVLTIVTFISVNFGYPAFAAIDKLNVANYTVICGALIQVFGILILYITENIHAISVVYMVLITELVIMTLRVGLFLYYKGIKKC